MRLVHIARMKPGPLVLAFLAAQLRLAVCGYLQWSLAGATVNYPFDSPFRPIIFSGPPGSSTEGVDDRVVVFTNRSSAEWTLSALQLTTGVELWALAVPISAAADAPQAVTTGVTTLQPSNQLNLAFFQLVGNLYAVDAAGSLLWSHPLPAAAAAAVPGHLSAWGSGAQEGVVYVSQVQPPSPTAPSLLRNTTVTALDAASGQQLWATNLTAIGTAAFGVTPIRGVAAAPSLALYASGSRVAAVAAASGDPAWAFTWSLPNTGLAPNVTDLQYVELNPSGDKLILLTSSSWQQQRFAVLRLEAATAAAVPPMVIWQSAQPEAAMEAYPTLAAPAVSATLARFYYWTNQTIYFPALAWEMQLVARSLLTGAELWRLPLPRALVQPPSPAVLPLAPPAPLLDRLFTVTTEGVAALSGGSGGTQWSMGGMPWSAAPFDTSPPGYSYAPAAAFSNNASYLVAMRCLGEQQAAGSLCVYGGFERAPVLQGAAAQAAQPLPAAALLAAAVVGLWVLAG